jgi:predicted nuclease of predicted toxin-antitoxin system
MRLLLNGHFSQRVSRPLRASGIDVFTLDEWHDGAYRNHKDEEILAVATTEERTLITYDVRIRPEVLDVWAAAGRSHAGVIFVSIRTIRQQDFGGQIRALRALVEEHGDEDWRDQVAYLRPA